MQSLEVTPESLAAEVHEIMDLVDALRTGNETPGARLHIPRPMAPCFDSAAEAEAACEQELILVEGFLPRAEVVTSL